MAKNRTQRDRLEILATILESCMEGTMKTRLMLRCNLTHEQMTVNLEKLQTSGLIRSVSQEGKSIYVTTEAGRRFIEAFRALTSLLNGDRAKVFTQYRAQKEKS